MLIVCSRGKSYNMHIMRVESGHSETSIQCMKHIEQKSGESDIN